MIKQNQSLFRPFPGENPELSREHFLECRPQCECSQCRHCQPEGRPEVGYDFDLDRLRSNPQSRPHCDHLTLLDHLHHSKEGFPRLQFLDTVVLEDGAAAYALFYEKGRVRTVERPSVRSWLLGRKEQLDLAYQIGKYEGEHPGFSFTAFEHESEKRIKEFETNIKYKISAMENRVAYVKVRGREEELLLAKSEFEDLFDPAKRQAYDLRHIEYMQVFPVMCREEHHSYHRTIRYFRARACQSKSYRLAQSYVSNWKGRNESLEKLEEGVWGEMAEAEGVGEATEEMRLRYLSYKLLVYFEDISHLRVSEALLHFITNDNGRSFFFRKIDHCRYEPRLNVTEVDLELPQLKHYPPGHRIHLPQEMRRHFQGFQAQFDRLQQERAQIDEKVTRDREKSDQVYRMLAKDPTAPAFHEVLQSPSPSKKRKYLGI